MIDTECLAELFGITTLSKLRAVHAQWIEDALAEATRLRREASENLAVGRPDFVEQLQERLGPRGMHRQLEIRDDLAWIREASAAYEADFIP